MKFVLLLAISVLQAQDTTIRTKVPLVVVPTSVTDRQSHPIESLSEPDFLLLDNGRPRPVRVDLSDSDSAPIALVLAIQSSGFSEPAIKKLRKTAAVISQAVLGANGEAAVLSFDETVTVKQDFTRNQDRIDNAVQQFKTSANSGGARQIDAIDQAMDLLNHRGAPRRACILLIGEARDRGSQLKLPGVLSELQRSAITIYALTYSPYWTAFTTRAKDYTPPPMDESDGRARFRFNSGHPAGTSPQRRQEHG